ncbi:MAG TPA: response regulator [Thermoanaerobaculia bacterium]|jgi:two-component system response regulator|nr:response regulator [Thermoanaerobaculia bacterium]
MNPKILLVEDNPDDVELTRLAFAENRLANEMVVAGSGDAALRLLFGDETTGPVNVALVLLDLKLPRVSGIEVLRQIRANERTRLLPVVVLTSSDEERDVVESYRLNANSYVRKPVDYSDFVTAVRQLGIYWMVVNIPPPGAAQ